MLTRLFVILIAASLVGILPPAARAAAAADADAAARQAAASTGGRVLDVQAGVADGRNFYLVKVILDDGRVRVVRIPRRVDR